jgi:hypothetical protein
MDESSRLISVEETRMNFRRGRQMIVHDPALNNPHTNPPTTLTPPVAFRRWTVHPRNSPEFILERVALVATQTGGLDALHFMGHGNQGFISVGGGTFSQTNADLFSGLRGKVSAIVFFSCLVGSDSQGWYRGHPTYFGQRVAAESGARTVVAHQLQTYSWDANRIIDFGPWEGPVDVFEPESGWSTYQNYNPFRAEPQLDLERVIFD